MSVWLIIPNSLKPVGEEVTLIKKRCVLEYENHAKTGFTYIVEIIFFLNYCLKFFTSKKFTWQKVYNPSIN